MESKQGRIIVVSAPSGTGKSTIINEILKRGDIDLQFSVSATNRAPREGETHGVNYYYLSDEEFQQAIADDKFVEWEEVYPGRFYGTLKSEIERICSMGHNVVLDIDVKGALNVKKIFPDLADILFIMPPSIEALRQRLENRGTETQEVIEQRLARAEFEIAHAPEFDVTIVNDDLAIAVEDTHRAIKQFVEK